MSASSSAVRRGQIALSLSFLLVFLALIAAGLRAARQDPSGAASTSAASPPGITVFLVRHAEKGTDDPTDPSLTEGGRERADALARLLSSAGVSHLYSSDYRRTRQTLAPLAAAHELEVGLYDAGKPVELVSVLAGLPPGSVAVVAGHSNTTPALFEALGAGKARGLDESRYGSSIPDAAYDRLYVVTLSAGRDGAVKCVDGLELRYGK